VLEWLVGSLESSFFLGGNWDCKFCLVAGAKVCRYLVKAVDSGESIRLQYRSLKKAGVQQMQAQAQPEMRSQQALTFLQKKQ